MNEETISKIVMGIILLAIVSFGVIRLTTSNSRAKIFGGTTTIKLKDDEKLVNVTWKDSNLWYLSRPMKKDEVAETYEFKEVSNLGILNGTVIFIEGKK